MSDVNFYNSTYLIFSGNKQNNRVWTNRRKPTSGRFESKKLAEEALDESLTKATEVELNASAEAR